MVLNSPAYLSTLVKKKCHSYPSATRGLKILVSLLMNNGNNFCNSQGFKLLESTVEFDEKLAAGFWRCAGATHEIYDIAQRPQVDTIFPELQKKRPRV